MKLCYALSLYVSNLLFPYVKLDGEVCGYPGDTDVISLWVKSVSLSTVRREEGESLYESHSEEHHLVPGQSLSHALPLANSERDQGRVLLVPGEE